MIVHTSMWLPVRGEMCAAVSASSRCNIRHSLCCCHRSGTARSNGETLATTMNMQVGKRRTLSNSDEHENEADVDDNDNTVFLLTVSALALAIILLMSLPPTIELLCLYLCLTASFLPARRYASAGLCESDVSVCPSVRLSVRHTPVLCLAERKQDREMYTV